MNPKTKIRKLADRAWYNAHIKPLCEICSKEAVQLHHYYFKGSYGHLRYDPDNGISLCQGCHFVLHAKDAKRIEQKIIEVRGKEWADNLEEKSKEKHESFQTMSYYKKVIEELK